MRESDPDQLVQTQKVIFLHIRKTAGTSLRAAMQKAMGPHSFLLWYRSNKSRDDVLSSLHSGFQVIFGHMEFGVHEELGLTPTYATVVRDPIARVISMYYYIKNERPDHPFHTELNRGMSIEDFVSHPRARPLSNEMVRVISGLTTLPPQPRAAVRKMMSRLKGGPQEAYPFDHALQVAKENIANHFVFVSTVDELARDTSRLQQLFGIDELNLQRKNVGRYDKKRISDSDLDAVKKYNGHDMELYRWIAGSDASLSS